MDDTWLDWVGRVESGWYRIVWRRVSALNDDVLHVDQIAAGLAPALLEQAQQPLHQLQQRQHQRPHSVRCTRHQRHLFWWQLQRNQPLNNKVRRNTVIEEKLRNLDLGINPTNAIHSGVSDYKFLNVFQWLRLSKAMKKLVNCRKQYKLNKVKILSFIQ